MAREVIIGLPELFSLLSEHFGLGLSLLEQVLGEGVGIDGIEDEPDAFGEPVEEGLIDLAEGREGGQFDHRAYRPIEQHWQDDDVERRGRAKTRVDLYVVAGNLGEEDPLFFLGALAH